MINEVGMGKPAQVKHPEISRLDGVSHRCKV